MTGASPGIGSIRDGTMTDRGHPDFPALGVELVDDAVSPHWQRAEPPKAAPQLVTGFGLAFQEPERFGNRIGDGPVQVKERKACSTSEYDPCHLWTAASEVQLVTNVLQGRRLAAL